MYESQLKKELVFLEGKLSILLKIVNPHSLILYQIDIIKIRLRKVRLQLDLAS